MHITENNICLLEVLETLRSKKTLTAVHCRTSFVWKNSLLQQRWAYPETPSAMANTPPASLLAKKASSPPLAAYGI
jgi:hypothetical protein